ncbi:MAG: GspE/PulE family protein [Phycisphaerae bacterium]
MHGFVYVNPVFLIVFFLIILGWAKFATWISTDLDQLNDQNETVWRSVLLGSFGLNLLLWIIIPNFAGALITNLIVIGGIFGYYIKIRVAQLGPPPNPLDMLTGKLGSTAEQRQAKKSAGQLALSYLNAAGRGAPLPKVDDPAYNGVVLLDNLIFSALEARAQRIDLIPSEQAYDVTYTTDGVGYPQSGMQRSAAEPIIQSVKLISGLSLDERRRPQKSSLTVVDAAHHRTPLVIRTSGTTAGERLTLVMSSSDSYKMPLDNIGLSSEQLAAVRTIVSDNSGLVIVASPPHMGRTTTLYSLIGAHDAYTRSIQTIEANPRAEFESITVNPFDPQAINASHSKLLQSICLKDPDIILVGQCPDAATAEVICRYASNDHRVYLGLRAGSDAPTIIDLWRKLLPDKELAARPLRAVVCQRLIRLLCPTCKIPYQPDAETLAKLNLPVGRQMQVFKANTQPARDPKGNPVKCPDCASLGYRGVTGLFEVLVVTPEIRDMIAHGRPVEEIRNAARKNGMMMLVEQGIRKFALGITSIQEVTRALSAERAKKTREEKITSASGSSTTGAGYASPGESRSE